MHEAERDETVRRIARSGDLDRALAALFAPRAARADLLALCAFNVELARIGEQVSEPHLGAIRLQWWRDAVERSASGEATSHPVADAIGATIRRRQLSTPRIEKLIDAREFEVAVKIMPDRETLDNYLENTAGALFALGAECLGAKGGAVEGAAERAGLAYGLTGLMRALPVHAARGLVWLPADALRRHGTSPEAVRAGKSGDGLLTLLGELREQARGALAEAQRAIAQFDTAARKAFLPLSLVEPYLSALSIPGHDPLNEIADINPLHRLWRMARWR